jgi:hypothetical protein
MEVYIVQLNDELKIFKVQPENDAAFFEEYKQFIVAKGSSIQDVIMQFAKLQSADESRE